MEDAGPDKGEQTPSEVADETHQYWEVGDDDCKHDGPHHYASSIKKND